MTMSRSFYVDSLILNQPPSSERDHPRTPPSMHHRNGEPKALRCYQTHTDTVPTCPICVRDQAQATCGRLPGMPPTSGVTVFKSPLNLPPHSTSGHRVLPARPYLDSYRDHHLHPASLGLPPPHGLSQHTPPTSHSSYRPTIDPRRLQYLPMGKFKTIALMYFKLRIKSVVTNRSPTKTNLFGINAKHS